MRKMTFLTALVCFVGLIYGQTVKIPSAEFSTTRAQKKITSNERGVKSLTLSIEAQNNYIPGSTMDINLTMELNSPDYEYGDFLSITFPSGITPVDGKSPIATTSENQGAEVLNGVDGQTISWGDNDNSYGGIEPGTYNFWIEVQIESTVNGTQEISFYLSGDQYGAAPNEFEGTFSLNQLPTVPDLKAIATGFISEYYAVPFEQVTSTVIGTAMNLGNTLNETTYFTVKNADGSYSKSSEIDLPLETNMAQTFRYNDYLPSGLGIEKFYFTAEASNDYDLTNSVDSATIEITETDLIRDNGQVSSYFGVSSSASGGILGNIFYVGSKDTLNSITSFHGNVTYGEMATSVVYSIKDGAPDELLATSIPTIFTDTEQEYITYFAGEGVILEEGYYFIGMLEDYGNMSIAVTTTPYIDGAGFVYYNGDWIELGGMGYPHTYYIRPGFGTEIPEFDIELLNLDIYKYVVKGNELTVEGTLLNKGIDPLTSIDMVYKVNNNTPVVESITGINVYGLYNFSLTTPIELTTAGDYNIKVYLSNPNGADDAIQSNDSLSILASALEYAPEKNILGEEATGTWCGWCVRGHVFMDYMAETYPGNWIGVAVHNSDPMVVTDYDAGIGDYIAGYPSGLVNRMEEFDPSEFEDAYLEMIELPSPIDINISDLNYDASTKELSFKVNANFLATIQGAMFNAVLIENEVSGTSSDWDQANYYSGGTYGEMGGYEALANPVPAEDMVYQNVARAILGGWNGTQNSISETANNGDSESYTYTITLDDEWNPDNMEIVGMVIANDGSILNSAKTSVINSNVNVNLTFNVNMAGSISSGMFTPGTDTLYVTGSFTDWNEPSTGGSLELTDADNDGNYTVTMEIAANFGEVQYKYFINAGWDGGEWEGEPNRIANIADADVATNDTWNNAIEDNQLAEIQLFPNPFNNAITLTNLEHATQIAISNMLGQQVLNVNVDELTETISTANLNNGIYFITITDTNNNTRTERIVKQ
jgi:hypothetical protein